MADELAVKVRVELDTDTKKLDAQMESVKSHFTKNPVKLAFTIDQQALRSNIAQAFSGISTKNLLPKMQLDTAVDTSKLNQQIKTALRDAGTAGGTDDLVKAYSGQLKQLYAQMKKLSDLQQKEVRLRIKTDDANQLDKITESIKKYEASIQNLKGQLANVGIDVGQLPEYNSLVGELSDKLELATAAAQDMQAAMDTQSAKYSSQADELERLQGKVDAYRETAQQLYAQGVRPSDYGFDEISAKLEESLQQYDDAASKLKVYKEAVKGLNQELGQMTKAVTDQNAALNETTQLDRLYTQINRFIDSNPNLGKNSDLLAKMNALQDAAASHTIELKDARSQWAALEKEAQQYGLVGETTLQKIGRLFKEHFNTSLIMLGIHSLQQGLQDIYQNVVEVDTAMTELKKVTNETQTVYNQFLSTATTRAKEYGASVADVVTATADAARLGLNLEDASALADASIVYKNVGDGITNVGDASSSVISTMKAFNIEAKDSMAIVDEFNEVGNKFAISSAGIGDALLRSASALAAGGNTLEESIALITAANDVVQNPESVGTTLKTVSMYLRATKTELCTFVNDVRLKKRRSYVR
ncbi:MAG: phage tail tape measure protein, partial [Escherichia coli]|nr:phage tail tape measure protein [Escherichia coli]